MKSLLRRRTRDDVRGQSLVEMILILPVLLMLTMGTLEFGFAFDHHITLEYASREGARTGAALSNGAGDATRCATIDPQIIAAVQRVLASPSSSVNLAEVPEIRIYRAGTNGQELGPVNRWRYAPGAGPTVDGQRLDFVQVSASWPACSRLSQPNPDSIGVSLAYTYRLQTPMTSFLGMASITMGDKTIMPLAPTDY